jgi:preprotein translocase subunit YajC
MQELLQFFIFVIIVAIYDFLLARPVRAKQSDAQYDYNKSAFGPSKIIGNRIGIIKATAVLSD